MAVTGDGADALRRRLRLEQGRRLRHRAARGRHLRAERRRTTSRVSGGGPSGLVLDEAHGRLYVLTRFDNAHLGRSTRRRDARSRTCRCTTRSRRASSNGRPVLYDARAHVEQRRGVVRELPHLRRLRQPRLGPRQPRRRRSLNNPNPFRVPSRRHDVRLPSAEGPDDDAEPARHGEPRPDALARRPHRRQRPGRRRARRGRGVQEVHRRLRRAARPRRRRSATPTCRRSPTSSCR